LVCPHVGAKWKTIKKTSTTTDPTYARNAACREYPLSKNHNIWHLKEEEKGDES